MSQIISKEDFEIRLKEALGVEFSNEQKAVIFNDYGPTCVMSCAGSGKSTVLLSNIMYLEEVKKISASKIIAISFNRDAVNDLKLRYKELRKKLGKSVLVSPSFETYHSLFLNLLKSESNYKKVKVVDNNYYTYKLLNFIHTDGVSKASEILNRYFSLRSKMISDGKGDDLINFVRGNDSINLMKYFKDSEINSKNFREVMFEYESLKSVNNDIDFEDMMLLLYDELFNQDNKKIIKRFNDVYSHIYIDEYQDISYLQMVIMDKLLNNNTNLTCIGDSDQCIYKFRGSSPEYILDFDINYVGSKILYLGSNYRCKRNILNPVIPVIEKNKKRVKHNLESYFEGGEVHKIVGTDDKFVQSLKDDYENKNNPIILVRLNMQQKLLSDVLVEHGVPVKLKNPDSTLRKDAVYKGILDLIKAIKEDDTQKMMTLRFRLFPWIQKNVWDSILMYSDGWLDTIVYSGKYKVPQETIDLINKIKEKDLMQNLIVNAYKLLEKSYESQIKKGYVSKKELKAVINHMYTYSEGKDLETFLHDEALKESVLLSNYENNVGIKINTLHSVKGLEFDTVYLYGLDNDIIPDEKRFNTMTDIEIDDYIEEERRLFYVGWTRAKNKLVYHYHNEENKSMFIDELGI